MLGSFLEHSVGHIIAPDDKVPKSKVASILEILAPDPEYYEGKDPAVKTPEKKWNLSDRPQSFAPVMSSNISDLSSQVMNAAVNTADTISSPPLVWEKRKNLFNLLSSTGAKSVKRFEKRIRVDPSLATIRCANMGYLLPDGFTPLHAAAYYNNIEAVKVLLALKDGDRQLVSSLCTDLQGRTPLHIAAERGFIDIIAFLRMKMEEEVGENPVGERAPVDLVGRTPLGWAALGWAVTSKHASAKENKARVREELFSPGDNSICPVTPGTNKNKSKFQNVNCGCAEFPGWRVDMEDATLLDEKRGIFGVFDGHGDGGSISNFLAKHFGEIWDGCENENESRVMRLEMTCRILDSRLKRIERYSGGSTAVVGIVTENKVTVANVGDSRAVIAKMVDDKCVAVPMSIDHKPDLPQERKRILSAGLTVIEERCSDGEVIHKVQLTENDKIALSRAFGDFDYKANPELPPDEQAITSLPDIVCHERSKNDLFLILACDGVWDVMTNDECCEFVAESSKISNNVAEIGEKLLNECLKKGSQDNMSVVIVSLEEGINNVVESIKTLNFEE